MRKRFGGGEEVYVIYYVVFMLYLYVKDRDLYTPLHAAAASGNIECVHTLINAGADIEAKNVYGNTPLHIACLNGCPLVIKALMSHVNLGESRTTSSRDFLGEYRIILT